MPNAVGTDGEIADELFRRKASWIELIKSLRATYGVNTANAERLALSHDGWRRWCERQVNTEKVCRKYALFHIRNRGEKSLLEVIDDRITVKVDF